MRRKLRVGKSLSHSPDGPKFEFLNLIWDSNKIKYYEASFFENTTKIHNIDFLSTQIVDQARDCLHPGPKTAKSVAEFIARKLNV